MGVGPFAPSSYIFITIPIVNNRNMDVLDDFGLNRLPLPRALLRKVGETSDSMVVYGKNKQLPRR